MVGVPGTDPEDEGVGSSAASSGWCWLAFQLGPDLVVRGIHRDLLSQRLHKYEPQMLDKRMQLK